MIFRIVTWLLLAVTLSFAPDSFSATRYVSNSTANGWASGTNSGAAATTATPWLTLEYAITNATAGDSIILNDGIYSVAGGYFPNKTLTISGFIAGAVTLRASSGNQVVVANGPTSATITLVDLILDAQSTQLYCFYAQDNSTNAYAIVLTRVSCINNPTTNGFRIGSALTGKITFTATDISVTTSASNTVQAGIYVLGNTAGAVTLIRPVVTLGKQNTATLGGIYINMLAADLAVTITDPVVNMTLDSSLTLTSFHYCIRVVNGNPVSITGAIVTCNDNGTSRTIYGIQATPSTTAPFTSAIAITNPTVNMSWANGIAIIVGQDGSTGANTYHPNAAVTGCTVNGTARSETAQAHGVLMGYSANQTIAGCKVSRTYLSYAFKGSSGTSIAYDNIAQQFVGYAITTRAATDVQVTNNTLYWPSSSTYQNAYGFFNWADGGTLALRNNYANNLLYSEVNINSGWVYSEASSTATYDSNTYGTTVATTAVSPWQYNGTGYATFPLWQAALGATDEQVNAHMQAADGNYYPRSRRLARRGVTISGAVNDYNGTVFFSPSPGRGAIQSHTTPQQAEQW